MIAHQGKTRGNAFLSCGTPVKSFVFRMLCHQQPLQPEHAQLHFFRMLKIQVPDSLLGVVHPCQRQ